MLPLTDTLKGEALALAALLLFSCNIILTKVASARLALGAGFLVAIIANIGFSALLFAIELAVRTRALQWDWVGVLWYALAGAFATYLGRWFFFESIARLGPAKASIFQVSSPLFTVIIAWVALADSLSAGAVGAIVVTLLGLLLVSASPRQLLRLAVRGPQPAPRVRARDWRTLLQSGLVLGIASSASYAVGNVLRGAGGRRWDEPILGALIGALTAIALQLLLARDTPQTWREIRTGKRAGVLLFTLSGTMTITAQMCVISAMGFMPIAVVALITLCTPLLVLPMSYFLLGNQEGIGARTVAGGALVLGGIAVLTLR